MADDFKHPFGDPDEARLKAALGYREDETCPETTMAADRFLLAEGLDETSVGPAIRGLMIPGTGTP